MIPMPEHKHILVVDDESQISRVLRTSLSSHGYDIRVANDGETALEIMKDWTPDLVITDLAMPNMDGLELCRRLRAKTQIPIIVLSVRGEERTKVKALDAGADDYVTKPFDTLELMARVEALLRRAPMKSDTGRTASGSERYRFGSFVMDIRRAEVTRSGKPVNLTAREFQLLRYFAEHPGIAITRDELLREVWGHRAGTFTRTVDMHIASLRQKLEDSPKKPGIIITVPGIGYRLLD